jgi:hypothetical protein
MKNIRCIVLFIGALFICLLPFSSAAQLADTLRIRGVQKVAKGEELKINAGTQVIFEPGATLWVEGGLTIAGDAKSPVVFSSAQADDPGLGIVINGNDPESQISVKHATFTQLARAFSFEPFWNRKAVSLDHIVVSHSVYNEAVIFVATPLLVLNKQSVSFELSNAHFIQNKGGIIIDNVGSSGIVYTLDHLVFQNNTVQGNDNSLGIIHLHIASPYQAKNLRLGEMVFIQNTANNQVLGLSLGGSQETIAAKGIYSLNGTRSIYDSQQDARLPKLDAPLIDAYTYSKNLCFIEATQHQQGQIVLKGKKLCAVKQVLDSNLIPIQASISNAGDSISIAYTSGIAAFVVLENGLKEALPALPIIDSALSTPPVKPPVVVPDTLINPSTPFSKSYEVGLMAGLAFYVGDIKHRFGIPGVFDWSKSIFLQYNKSPRVSYRFGFSRTNIGMHNPTAALALFRSADTYGRKGKNYFLIPSFQNNFKTEIYSLDVDFIYHLGTNNNKKANQTEGKKGYWIPSIGTGASLCYFEPYRMIKYSRYKDSAEFIKLRPLGMEGQNFLASKKDYLPITLNVNLSFQLAYAYKNWRLRYEIKAIMSFSDYLDDYGQGFTYGGNYDKWKESVGEIDLPIDQKTGKPMRFDKVFPNNPSADKRTTNLLPDMFFPQHIGVSYVLGRKK